jgi:hypothetical protein
MALGSALEAMREKNNENQISMNIFITSGASYKL